MAACGRWAARCWACADRCEAAAGRGERPVSIVSLYSKPGSRRCVWRSMKPGQTTSPLASIVSLASLPALGPTSATRPSASASQRDVELFAGSRAPAADSECGHAFADLDTCFIGMRPFASAGSWS